MPLTASDSALPPDGFAYASELVRELAELSKRGPLDWLYLKDRLSWEGEETDWLELKAAPSRRYNARARRPGTSLRAEDYEEDLHWRIIKAVAALANTHGGVLFVGIKDGLAGLATDWAKQDDVLVISDVLNRSARAVIERGNQFSFKELPSDFVLQPLRVLHPDSKQERLICGVLVRLRPASNPVVAERRPKPRQEIYVRQLGNVGATNNLLDQQSYAAFRASSDDSRAMKFASLTHDQYPGRPLTETCQSKVDAIGRDNQVRDTLIELGFGDSERSISSQQWRPKRLILYGMAGQGKTTIAEQVAHEAEMWLDLGSRRPKRRVLFIHAKEARTPAELFGQFKLTLHPATRSLLDSHLRSRSDQQASPTEVALAAALGPQPALVVIDNCEQLNRDAIEWMHRFANEAASTAFLYTSQKWFGAEWAEAVKCVRLDSNDAVRLFFARLDRINPSEDDRQAVEQFVNDPLVDGNPLIIKQVASRLVPQDSLATRLKLIRQNLFEHAKTVDEHVKPEHRSLEAALKWSISQLSKVPRDVLIALAMTGNVDVRNRGVLEYFVRIGLTERDVEGAIRDLGKWSFLGAAPQGLTALHPSMLEPAMRFLAEEQDQTRRFVDPLFELIIDSRLHALSRGVLGRASTWQPSTECSRVCRRLLRTLRADLRSNPTYRTFPAVSRALDDAAAGQGKPPKLGSGDLADLERFSAWRRFAELREARSARRMWFSECLCRQQGNDDLADAITAIRHSKALPLLVLNPDPVRWEESTLHLPGKLTKIERIENPEFHVIHCEAYRYGLTQEPAEPSEPEPDPFAAPPLAVHGSLAAAFLASVRVERLDRKVLTDADIRAAWQATRTLLGTGRRAAAAHTAMIAAARELERVVELDLVPTGFYEPPPVGVVYQSLVNLDSYQKGQEPWLPLRNIAQRLQSVVTKLSADEAVIPNAMLAQLWLRAGHFEEALEASRPSSAPSSPQIGFYEHAHNPERINFSVHFARAVIHARAAAALGDSARALSAVGSILPRGSTNHADGLMAVLARVDLDENNNEDARISLPAFHLLATTVRLIAAGASGSIMGVRDLQDALVQVYADELDWRDGMQRADQADWSADFDDPDEYVDPGHPSNLPGYDPDAAERSMQKKRRDAAADEAREFLHGAPGVQNPCLARVKSAVAHASSEKPDVLQLLQATEDCFALGLLDQLGAIVPVLVKRLLSSRAVWVPLKAQQLSKLLKAVGSRWETEAHALLAHAESLLESWKPRE